MLSGSIDNKTMYQKEYEVLSSIEDDIWGECEVLCKPNTTEKVLLKKIYVNSKDELQKLFILWMKR